jgi:hypothetical protein
MQKCAIVAFLAAMALTLTAVSEPLNAQSTTRTKVCRSKRPDGSIKQWTCRADQPCCVSHTFGLYTCGSQLLKCL